MAVYNPYTWIEQVTKVGPTRMNALELAVADASGHHKSGTYASIPPANASSQGYTYWATDRGVLYANFDGATWTRIGPGEIGAVKEYAGFDRSSPPVGHLYCDGTTYLQTAYPDLFSALTYSFSASTTVSSPTLSGVPAYVLNNIVQNGMTVYAGLGGISGMTVSSFNVGAGTITLSGNATSTQSNITVYFAPWGFTVGPPIRFSVPDFRDYFAIGADNMSGTSAGRLGAGNTKPPGGTGGEENHTLTLAESPAHSHTLSPAAPYTTASGSTTSGSGIPPHNGVASAGTWGGGGSSNSQGGGGSHNNMPPFRAVNKIIRAF